ncbi:MAG: hypothetical protein QXZ31_03745 [Thermofilaceae archaeon]
MRRALALTLALALVALLLAPASLSSSIAEFTVASVRVSASLYGSALAIPIPFRLSPGNYPHERNVYVLTENAPVYYHTFSVMPPLVLVFEPSMPTERTYRVYASFDNPYRQFSVPYDHPVFAAYDDFDTDSGMWARENARITGGSATISVNGWMSLNASLPEELGVFQTLRGGRGLRIELPAPGEHILVLTSANFTDWSTVIDGNDVYFVSETGEPQYYSIVYLDKEREILVAYVQATTSTIYMVYGGSNPYAGYRLW